MNERIKELTEQAEEYAAANATGDWEVGPAYQDLFNEKFAELIVQKCMSFQDEAGVYSKFDMANAIAQHFGVEE